MYRLASFVRRLMIPGASLWGQQSRNRRVRRARFAVEQLEDRRLLAGLQVEVVKNESGSPIASIGEADQLLDAPGANPRTVFEHRGAVDFHDVEASPYDFFDGGFQFEDIPILRADAPPEPDQFVVRFAGSIKIPAGPAPNTYTFAVVSDDGFRLTIGVGAKDRMAEWPSPRVVDVGPLLQVTFPAGGGRFPLELVYFEWFGGAVAEFAYARGSHTVFSTSTFQLVPPAMFANTAGPRIISASPEGNVAGPVDHLDVKFSEPIDRSTFTREDVSLRNPQGNAVVVQRVQPLGGAVFRIHFRPQREPGPYTFTVGPHIRDLQGNYMDQDRDGRSREALEDQFRSSFEIAPRTFVFSFLGFCGQTGQSEPSGMEKLAGAINNLHLPTVLVAQPLGWVLSEPGCQRVHVGDQVRLQMRLARMHVGRFLHVHQYDAARDRVVVIGHSYGGNLAYELARERASGQQASGADPVEGLILFDPIDWRRCSFVPPRIDCNQSDDQRGGLAGVPDEGVLNFVQRNPNEPEPRFLPQGSRFAGYTVAGAVNDQELGRGPDQVWGTSDDTTHSLIDDDTSPGEDGVPGNVDDTRLGLYARISVYLRGLASV